TAWRDESLPFPRKTVRQLVCAGAAVRPLEVPPPTVWLEEDVVMVGVFRPPPPLRPSGWHVGWLSRRPQSLIAVKVFADQAGPVAGVTEPGGDGRGIVELLGAAPGAAVLVDAGPMRVAAGQDAGSAGRGRRWRSEGGRDT